MKAFALIAVAVAMTPAWSMNKCVDASGRTTFQDAACEADQKAEAVRTYKGNRAAPIQAPLAGSANSHSATVEQAQSPVAPSPAPHSDLQREAAICLAWYKPLLRDPASAYFTSPSKEGRVVSVTVHATNGFGGFVTKTGACEFLNGRLDESWTKIHGKRNGWSVN